MSDWQDIKTAPTGTPFFGRSDGMVGVCMVYETPAKTTWKKPWPWSKATETTEPAQKYLGFALPGTGEYNILTMRPDRGWYPEEWLPLDEIPW